jgi:5-methylcytosine-specific restriction endonuclease McrA
MFQKANYSFEGKTIVAETDDVKYVLNRLQDISKITFLIDNVQVKVKFKRKMALKIKEDQKCISCGLEINKFLIGKYLEDTACLNLVPVNFENNLTISFTLDHRIPKVCGGSDDLYNLWLMCSQCNFVKSHYRIPYLNIKDIKKEYFEIKKTNHKLAGDFLEKERKKYLSWI